MKNAHFSHSQVPCTNSMTAKLPYAHYTDCRFDREQLVFDSGEAVKETDYTAYDDRLMQFDPEAYFRGIDAAKKEHQPFTAAFFQAFLTSYHQSPVELKKIWTGCNASNGYQYWAFAYSLKKQTELWSDK